MVMLGPIASIRKHFPKAVVMVIAITSVPRIALPDSTVLTVATTI